MDEVTRVPRASIFTFTGKVTTTRSRVGVFYLGAHTHQGPVIICKDDNSEFTRHILRGVESKGEYLAQVSCDDAFIEKGKLFGRIRVVPRDAALRHQANLNLSESRKVMKKLVVLGHTTVTQRGTTFTVTDKLVKVNGRGKGKRLDHISLSWIRTALDK